MRHFYTLPLPPELALVVGHAGAVVLRAAVFHTSYALVMRLGVDSSLTHSAQYYPTRSTPQYSTALHHLCFFVFGCFFRPPFF